MPNRDRLVRKTKQGATSIVKFGWKINIIKSMFINNAPSYTTMNVEAYFLIYFSDEIETFYFRMV
jgi:hypothetical protein